MTNKFLEKAAYQYQHMLKDRSRLYSEGEHEFDNTGIGHITPADLATAEEHLLSEDEEGNEIRPSLADMLDHVKHQKAKLHADREMTSLYGSGVEATAHDIKNKGAVGRGLLHMLSAGTGALVGAALTANTPAQPMAILGGAGVALGASLLVGNHAADKHERLADEFIARSSNKYLQKSAAISKQDYKKESSTGRAVGSYLLAGVSTGVVGSRLSAVAGQSAVKDFHTNEHHVSDAMAEKYRTHRNLNNVRWFREDVPGVGPAFSFENNSIHSKGNLAGMHEMGHAHSFNSSTPRMRKLKTMTYGLGRNGLGVLAGGAIALHGDSKESTAAGTAVAAASMAPMLIEEGRASLDPHNFIKKHGTPAQSKAFGRTMGKAFGSYAALAAAGAATPYLSRKVYDHFTQKAIDKRKKSVGYHAMEKAAALRDHKTAGNTLAAVALGGGVAGLSSGKKSLEAADRISKKSVGIREKLTSSIKKIQGEVDRHSLSSTNKGATSADRDRALDMRDAAMAKKSKAIAARSSMFKRHTNLASTVKGKGLSKVGLGLAAVVSSVAIASKTNNGK